MIFKTRKNRQFTYTPRFYDARKEELQERIKSIEAEVRGEKREVFSHNLRRGSFRQNSRSKIGQSRKAYTRLFVIVLVLFLVIYILYKIY